jgi:4-oxalomesaconate tautomerase
VLTRYFTPLATHEAMAVTGGICIASACKLPGTVAAGIARVTDAAREAVVLEHPTGSMEAVITTAQDEAGAPTIAAGGTLRTARLLMKGEIFVPSRIWAGKGA